MRGLKTSPSQAIHVGAFILSIALVALAIAAISLAGNASSILKSVYPAGEYEWNIPSFVDDAAEYFNVSLVYDESSLIKTLISAALSLVAGLYGIYAFGFSPRRPFNKSWLVRSLLLIAMTAFIASIICVSWSAVAEVKIKRSTCWHDDGAVPNSTYMCSVENAACNFIRFTQASYNGPGGEKALNNACLGLRHARFMMIPLAVISLVLVGFYIAMEWMAEATERNHERAERRVESLREE